MKNNEKFRDANYEVSGIDTSDKPYVFFFDLKEVRKSLKICVKSCPSMDINTTQQLYNYYKEEGTQYCRYDFNMNKLQDLKLDYEMVFHYTGPCPPLPIYKGSPILHRCIPTGENAPHKEIKELVNLISSWSFVEQTAKDLYKSWHIIALICGLSLIFSIILIGLLHYLTQIISWLICIFVGIASIGLTVILWMTYYDIKHKKENSELSQLAQYVQNETAVYVFAIIATMFVFL
jgi:solute carrier family 44 (choline transporter-like protein), member 1